MPTPPTDSFDMSTATPVAAGSLVSADRIGIVDMSGPTPVVATLGEFIKFYISPISGIVKSNGSTLSAAVAGTDYLAPTGSGAGLTGITVSQVSGALAAANNLWDVADAAQAANNLNLGTVSDVTFQSVSANTFSGDGSGLTSLSPSNLSGPVGVGFGGLGASNASSTGVPLFTAGVVTIVATSGTGNFIRATSPTLVTPDLGTPSALVLTNATGLPIGGLSATGTPSSSTFLRGDNTWATPAGGGNVSNVGTPTSGQIAEWTGATMIQGVAVTGSGSVVRATSPTLVTPALGTPSALVLTNATGLPVGGLSATGTPSSSTYLRGDNTWATPGGGGTVTSITLTQPAAGLTITGSGTPITSSGTPTFALANDLAAVEGLSSTGLVRRTGTDTWSAGTAVALGAEVSGTLPTANGGLGLDNSAATGVPVFSAGAVTITGTTGTGSVVRQFGPVVYGQLGVYESAGSPAGLDVFPNADPVVGQTVALAGGGYVVLTSDAASGTAQVGLGNLGNPPAAMLDLAPAVDTDAGFLFRSTSGHTALPIEVRNGAKATVFSVSAAGAATAASVNGVTVTNGGSGALTVTGTASVSGSNTGDQTSVTGNAGTATALATARAIYGNNFDGTAALTQVIASTYGGTGNGFTKFTGPTTSEKTFTLPNASATVLTDNAAVTVAQGGTGGTTAAAARSGIGFVTLTTTATTGTVTLDCAADNPTFVLSLTGNVTIALSNEADGRRFTLFVRGQASGYTLGYWSGLKWPGGAAPTIPATSGRVLPISFIRLAAGEWLGIPGTECY